jgi:hypothetical protein
MLARLRWRLGMARLELMRAIRWPIRLRRPLFSPRRECHRIVARQPAVRADRTGLVGDWETHEPVLVDLLALHPEARVLELGIGYGSTPLVLGLSGSSVSLETNESWFRRFARYDSASHRIVLWTDFSDWEWHCPYLDDPWDVAFVDNAPAHSRQSNLVKLAARTRYVVCHDTQECFGPSPSDYRWDFSSFKHVWTYTQYPTYTTVVSNFEPVPLDHLQGTHGAPRGGGAA